MALPHEVERLGPAVQSWVEQQLLNDLRHLGGGYGVASACIGGGQGIAAVLAAE